MKIPSLNPGQPVWTYRAGLRVAVGVVALLAVAAMVSLKLFAEPPAGKLRILRDARTSEPLQNAVANGTIYRFEARAPRVNLWQVPVPLDGVWIESHDRRTLTWISTLSGASANSTEPCPSGPGRGGSGDCPLHDEDCGGQPLIFPEICCENQPYDPADGCCVDDVWYWNGDPVGNCTNCVGGVVTPDPCGPGCDTDAPSITCPPDLSQNTANGECTVTVSFPTPAATDNCDPNPSVSCSPASGSTFPLGTTTVTCVATDASGNSASCSFSVTVQEHPAVPPIINCPSNIVKENDDGQCSAVVTYPQPTVQDNCPGATVTCTPPSGSQFGVGITTVTCTARDASGNTSTCSFSVTVRDTEPPAIGACPANITQCFNTGGAVVTYTKPGATDSCPGVTVDCVPPSGSTFPVGEVTTVTCTATDASGNTDTCTFEVTIIHVTIDVITACYLNDPSKGCVGVCGKACPPGGSLVVEINPIDPHVSPDPWLGTGALVGVCGYNTGHVGFNSEGPDPLVGVQFDIFVDYTLNGVTCSTNAIKMVPEAVCGWQCPPLLCP